MNRQRNRRSLTGVNRARRIRPMHASTQLGRTNRRQPASPGPDEAALALLTEILIGDSAWTMSEVQQLISMRESADLGRWRVAELDDEEASAR